MGAEQVQNQRASAYSRLKNQGPAAFPGRRITDEKVRWFPVNDGRLFPDKPKPVGLLHFFPKLPDDHHCGIRERIVHLPQITSAGCQKLEISTVDLGLGFVKTQNRVMA